MNRPHSHINRFSAYFIWESICGNILKNIRVKYFYKSIFIIWHIDVMPFWEIITMTPLKLYIILLRYLISSIFPIKARSPIKICIIYRMILILVPRLLIKIKI